MSSPNSTPDADRSAAPSAGPQQPTEPQQSTDRSAYIATLGFPLLVIIGGLVGFVGHGSIAGHSDWVNPLLGVIMFGMGLTLRPTDFVLVVKRPLPVLIGVVAHYVIMPLAALLVVWVLRLPDAVAAGVILVGCAPSGTASNVVAFLARGDLALSVAMSSISTLIAPVMTPLLTLWLAGEYMPLEAGDMALDIVKVVLLPVLVGLLAHIFVPRIVEKILPVLPWVSVLAIAVVVALVISGAHDKILDAGISVLAAVVLHNLLGLGFGFGAGKLFRQPEPACRTMAVEVGMQNSGLAAGLAAQYMEPLSALPGAIFSVWHNVSGALFAMLCRAVDNRRARSN